MVSNTDPSVNFYLSDVSQRDKPWDKHKSNSVHIGNALSLHNEFLSRSTNINACADWLKYLPTDELGKPLKLSKANFCRDRACPICQWRRALRWSAVTQKQMPDVAEAYPTHRWLFVTLTMRNCQITELRATISELNKAFNALFRKLKKRLGDKLGYIKSVEITRNKRDDTAHPHLHVMLFVPAEYFGKGYIKQAEWVELWQTALKCDYTPVLDVRAIKPKRKQSDGLDALDAQKQAVGSAIAETIKYAVKPSDLLIRDKQGAYTWFYEFLRQTKGLRFIAIGGVLKGLIKAEWETQDNDSMIHINDGDVVDTTDDDDDGAITFNFSRLAWRYVF